MGRHSRSCPRGTAAAIEAILVYPRSNYGEGREEGVKGKVSITAGDKENNSLLTIDFSENGVNTTWSATIFHNENYDLDYFYECWVEKYLQSDPYDVEEWKKTLKFNRDNKDKLTWVGIMLAA